MNLRKTAVALVAGMFVTGAANAAFDYEYDEGVLGTTPKGHNVSHANGSFMDQIRFEISSLSTMGGLVTEFNMFGLDVSSGWAVSLYTDANQVGLVQSWMGNDGSLGFAKSLSVGDYYMVVSGAANGSAPLSSGAYSYSLTAAPVPEPGELALMLSGLGLMGYMVRRRQNASV